MEGKTSLKIITLDCVDSTNNYAASLAQEEAPEITIVRAKKQTRGKGRLQRQWVSPKNTGIYVSFLLRPPNSLSEIYFFPLICALSVVRALKCYLPLTIKPPNDIMANKKKIGGVLVEAKSKQDKAEFIVAGIGININSKRTDLPQEATSLLIENGEKYNIEEIFKKLISEMIGVYTDFKKGHLQQLMKEIYHYQEKKSLRRLRTQVLVSKAKKENIHLL
ncbi:MAG: biotin--[acetyl-CoA-carboxylase] ligase [Candidatus Omnitrophica bacterium]|nr:biotin--[acetyl-CoA-carboxylase] ligase [Candidatus Omnitrophota bacterium]